MSSYIDAVNGANLVHVDEDLELMVVWNGSATFNVYTGLHEPENLNPADCFTRYACEQGYGPRDAGMSWDEGAAWAQGCIDEWLEEITADSAE